MGEEITRRRFVDGGLGAVLAASLGTLVDGLVHKDMVPLSELREARKQHFADLDRLNVQHANDLKAQFERHLKAYEKWMETGCP